MSVANTGYQLVLHTLFDMGCCRAQPGHPINHINNKVKAVDLVVNSQLQGRVDITLFNLYPHMNSLLISTAVH